MASGQVTEWLARWRRGEPGALDRLVPLLYDELRALARRQLRREAAPHTLSATALVHEVYLRLLQQRQIAAEDRHGFLTVAAATMRRILVDHARSRGRKKRGGGRRPVSLDDEPALLTDREVEEVLALDIALERLVHAEPRSVRVVECRIFAGLSLEETAAVLGVSTKTVQRTWAAARAWLRKEIGDLPETS